jgi:uncharacterized repeat protein (TIGR02543 family)
MQMPTILILSIKIDLMPVVGFLWTDPRDFGVMNMSPSRWFFIAVVSFVALFFTANVNTANAPGFTGGLDISEYYFYPAFDEETQFSAQACQDANPAYSYSPSYTFSSDLAYSGQGLGEVVLFGDDLLWQIDGFFHTPDLVFGSNPIRLDAQDDLLFEPDEGRHADFLMRFDDLPAFYVSPVVPSRLVFEGDVQYRGDTASDGLNLPDGSQWVFLGASSQERVLSGTHYSRIYAVRLERSSFCTEGTDGFVLLVEGHPTAYLIEQVGDVADDFLSETKAFPEFYLPLKKRYENSLRSAEEHVFPFFDSVDFPKIYSYGTVLFTDTHGMWIVTNSFNIETIDQYNGDGTLRGKVTCTPNPVYSNTTECIAEPAAGFDFCRWNGCDSTSDRCTLSPIRSDREVTAEFVRSFADGCPDNSPIFASDLDKGTYCRSREPIFSYREEEENEDGEINIRINFACLNSGNSIYVIPMPDPSPVISSIKIPDLTASRAILNLENGGIWRVAENDFSSTLDYDDLLINSENIILYEMENPDDETEDWNWMSFQISGDVLIVEDMGTAFDLDISIVGEGTVTSDLPGIDCGVDCIHSFAKINPVTLTAKPAANYSFTGWSGGCEGSTTTCTLTMDSRKSVTATFEKQADRVKVLEVEINGRHLGTVTSDPAGIICGKDDDDCEADYENNISVELLATPRPGYRFAGWTEDCVGLEETCTIEMGADKKVVATFTDRLFEDTATLPANIDRYTIILTEDHGIWVVTDGSWSSLTAGDESIYAYQLGLEMYFASLESGVVFNVAEMTDPSPVFSSTKLLENINAGTVLPLANGQVWKALESLDSAAVGFAGETLDVFIYKADEKQWMCFLDSGFTIETELLTVISGSELRVNLNGNGTVTSTPTGISCGDFCNQFFAAGMTINLIAQPESGYTFTGWLEDCEGSDPTCTVSIDANKHVTATFAESSTGTPGIEYSLGVRVTEGGTVTSKPAGIFCSVNCEQDYQSGTVVELLATPDYDHNFIGWTGDCAGSQETCDLPMNTDKNAKAIFERKTDSDNHILLIDAVGPGQVASVPSGIDCEEATCRAEFSTETEVTLTATPDTEAHFTGWSGDCTGSNLTCELPMTASHAVSARFIAQNKSANKTHIFGAGDDQVEVTGTTGIATDYVDFGGTDTFTLMPNLAGPVKLIDRQSTVVNLPASLRIEDAEFRTDGVRFTINRHSATLLGNVRNFTFVFAGDAEDASAGQSRSYAETAAAFGASIPTAGGRSVATRSGTIQADGNVTP